ncbi:MAG: hypothetical protein SOZ00_04930 [Tidjanibacter sp.]|nr:hypothetical protein [Tidjanibacter sp.]
MKKLLIISAVLSLCLSAFGQEQTGQTELLQTTPSAQLIYSPAEKVVDIPPKKWPFSNEIAFSALFGSVFFYDSGYYVEPAIAAVATPYTSYKESQTIVGQPTAWSYGALQYYHRISGSRLYFGAIASASGVKQNVVLRTTGARLNTYNETNIYFVPNVRWNFIQSYAPEFRAYLSVGAALGFGFEQNDGANTVQLKAGLAYMVGMSIGNRVYFFDEVGTALGSEMINIGFGFRF